VRAHEKRRAKVALADEDCQYDGVDDDEARSLRKNYCGTVEIQWSPHLEQQENTVQDAQKGDLLTRPTLARQDASCP